MNAAAFGSVKRQITMHGEKYLSSVCINIILILLMENCVWICCRLLISSMF